MNLRNRYEVRSRVTSRDSRGELVSHYKPKVVVWGEVPRSGSGVLQGTGSGLFSEETYRFRTRYVPGVTPGDQIVSEGLELYVQSAIDLDGTRKWLQVVATRAPR